MKKKQTIIEHAPSRPHREYLFELLQDSAEASAYLDAFLEDGTPHEIKKAIQDILTAQASQSSQGAKELKLRCGILLQTLELQETMKQKKTFFQHTSQGITITIPSTIHSKK